MVINDSEMSHAVNHAGRVCSEVGFCEGDLFLRQVWRFMLLRACMPCIPLFEDNEGAIRIAKHPISNSNSKHIDVRHHFLREFVDRKEIEIIHVASQYQHAAFLTKALPERELECHRGIVIKLM